MKEKKRNYKNSKDAAIITGQEQNRVTDDLEMRHVLKPKKITFNMGRSSSDFALKPRKNKKGLLPQQKPKTSSQSSGSHSLTALHYFKSSGR